jgi:2-polyprenyl-6-hydroxyphenyl methylase/3-demethylubiquinone-9 3-methyltransferase
MGTLADGSAFHEGLAGDWSARYSRGAFRRRYEFVTRNILALVHPTARWLDAGCGSGVFSLTMARMGAHVTGVDGSPSMIESANEGIPEGTPFLHFSLIETIEKLPLDAESFDGVLCLSVLEYVDDVDAALAELVRVLRPHGTLVMTIPNSWSAFRCWQTVVRSCGHFIGRDYCSYLAVSRNTCTRKTLRHLLVRHGLNVTHTSIFSPICPALLSMLGMGSLWLAIAQKPDGR